MRTELLRIDPAVRGLLDDPSLEEIARLIEPYGDCVACHRPLGEVPISLTLRRRGHAPGRASGAGIRANGGPGEDVAGEEGAGWEDMVVVLPAHAACAPSQLEDDRSYAPTATYQIATVGMPAAAQVEGASGQVETVVEQLPVVVINPSVDVQLGTIHGRRWRSQLSLRHDLRGLEQLSAQQPVPAAAPTWGARLHVDDAGDEILDLTSPGELYRTATTPVIAEMIRRSGQVLVVVTETAKVKALFEVGRLDQLAAAVHAGTVYGAWAGLGVDASDITILPPDASLAGSLPSGTRQLGSTAEVAALVADTAADARAAYARHPTVRLGADVDLVSTGTPSLEPFAGDPGQLPVLLIEPHTVAVVQDPATGNARYEIRVENAVGQGLRRLSTGRVIVDVTREWTLRRTGHQLELVAPFEQVLADVTLRLPAGWPEAARAAGHVLVVYGVGIGVRRRAGVRSFNDDDRHGELLASRRAGTVAVGLVRWTETGDSR